MHKLTLIPAALIISLGLAFAISAGQIDPPSGPVQPTGRFGTRIELNSLPGLGGAAHTITESGSYYLSSDIDATGSIRIEASDVTIDLNGYTVFGTGTFGIQTGGGAGGSVTLRNGKFTGFANGVALGGPGVQLVRVENVTVTDCTSQGINVESDGFIAGCVVKNCNANGIRVGGGNVLITNCVSTGNTVRGITMNGSGQISNCVALGNGEFDLFATNGLVRGCVGSTIVTGGGGTQIDNHQP